MEMCAAPRLNIVGEPSGANERAGAAGTRLLVVTHDEDLSAAITRVLTAEGFRVSTALHSGHAVLACLTSQRFDVLLAELTLDDMPGEALARTLRRHQPDLLTLFMAPAGTPPRPGLIVRPFTRDHLLAELSAVNSRAISSPAS